MRLILTVAAAALLVSCATADSGARVDDSSRPLRFEFYTDEAGKCRWKLLAANGELIAEPGQGYSFKEECISAIERVRRAADAVIKKGPSATRP